MEKLTVQINLEGTWHDAGYLSFPEPEIGRKGPVTFQYDHEYAAKFFERNDCAAVGSQYPVLLFEPFSSDAWPGWLDDIMPAGAARNYWIKNLGLTNKKDEEQDFQLLRSGAIAPVGNIRIKEALPYMDNGKQFPKCYFSVDDVIEKSTDFLAHANELGAVGGGATGAGGEAPKYLLRLTEDSRVWIDAYQHDNTNVDTHYLIKYPRNRGSERDKDILRAEFAYYKALDSLGITTVNTQKMKLVEEGKQPSLWLPRFDVGYDDESGNLIRYGLQSVYSLFGKPSGYLRHLDVLTKLVKLLFSDSEPAVVQKFVTEWVIRDFLSVVFGNSDNHGRNTSFIKRPGEEVWLSPVYDFAPMVVDDEGITRLTKWGTDFEKGSEFKWIDICYGVEKALVDIKQVDGDAIVLELADMSAKLVDLKHRLANFGVPDTILKIPALGFNSLNNTLEKWGLV